MGRIDLLALSKESVFLCCALLIMTSVYIQWNQGVLWGAPEFLLLQWEGGGQERTSSVISMDTHLHLASMEFFVFTDKVSSEEPFSCYTIYSGDLVQSIIYGNT